MRRFSLLSLLLTALLALAATSQAGVVCVTAGDICTAPSPTAQPTPTPDGTKANTTLNNLGSVALNADIVPAAANARTQGSATFPFVQEYFGESSSLYSIFGWSSADTTHHTRIAVDSTNRTLSIIDKANDSFNYAAPSRSFPSISVYSANQNTSQYTMIQHNGTDGVITVGTGGLQVTAQGSPSYVWLSGGSNIQLPVAGQYAWSSTTSANGSSDTFLTRPAAATFQLGAADAASPVAQTLQGQGSRGGTDSNVAAPAFTVRAGAGTGNSAGTKFAIQRSLMGASGTTAQTRQDALVLCESKTLSNTSATTTALANLAVASGAQGGARVTISVQCTNGTEGASSTVTSYQSFANKAGTISFGTATTQTESNGASTGATINCTVAPTWTASGNSVNVNVTPIITGAATTTVGFVNIENLGAGVVTCN